jgi:hypothetical protein
MKIGTRKYLWSLVAGIVLTALVGVTSSLLPSSESGLLLAPGVFGAALVFSEGVHSARPMSWIVLAAVLNVFFFSGAVFGIWALIGRSRRPPSKEA